MSTEQTTTTSEETTPVTTTPTSTLSKPAKKRTAKKKVVKKTKPVAKKAAKKAKKKSGGKQERKAYVNDGKMLNMHYRILKVLRASKTSLTTAEVAAKGGLTEGITAQYLGQLDEKARTRFEKLYLHYPTLVTQKWVKIVPGKPRKSEKTGEFTEVLGPAEFEITASGANAFKKFVESPEGKEIVKKLAEKDQKNKRKPIKLK